MLVPVPSAAPPSTPAFTGIALRRLLRSRRRWFRSGLRLNFIALPESVAVVFLVPAFVAAFVRVPLAPVLAPAALLGRLLGRALGTWAGAPVAVAPTSFP